MKKILSFIISTALLFSMTAGIDFSAYADTSYTMGSTVNGSISSSVTTRNYGFTLNTSGMITLTFTSDMDYVKLIIRDVTGEIYSDTIGDGTSSYIKEKIDLLSGTYTFKVVQYSSNVGNYSFKMAFSSTNETFSESVLGSNYDDATSAKSISLGKTYKGQLAYNDRSDCYKFTLSSAQNIKIEFNNYRSYCDLYIYDSKSHEIWSDQSLANDSFVSKSSTYQDQVEDTVSLSSGTYYFCIELNTAMVKYTGTYDFVLRGIIKSAKLSFTSCTYNGNTRKPSVTVKNDNGKTLKENTDYTVTYASGRKNVGKYKVTIKFIGNYKGNSSKTLYFTIKPRATTISKITAKSKGFTLKWSRKTAQTTGYQIQYSTSKDFSNAKTVTISKNSTGSKTISKLKAKKKYYVRVRTYKTVDGKKYYSSWSKSKTITTKK